MQVAILSSGDWRYPSARALATIYDPGLGLGLGIAFSWPTRASPAVIADAADNPGPGVHLDYFSGL